jgi:hypothetical protein
VQLGTPFAVTEEGDAHLEFKRVLAGARPRTSSSSPAWPACRRARCARPGCSSTSKAQPLQAKSSPHAKARCVMAFDCLIQCGLRDGIGRLRPVLHRQPAGRGAARRRAQPACSSAAPAAAVRRPDPPVRELIAPRQQAIAAHLSARSDDLWRLALGRTDVDTLMVQDALLLQAEPTDTMLIRQALAALGPPRLRALLPPTPRQAIDVLRSASIVAWSLLPRWGRH